MTDQHDQTPVEESQEEVDPIEKAQELLARALEQEERARRLVAVRFG